MEASDHVVAMGRPVEVHGAERGGATCAFTYLRSLSGVSGVNVVHLILRVVGLDGQLLSSMSTNVWVRLVS